MMSKLILTTVLVLFPTAALAHTGHTELSGFLHPFAGLDHVLAMVAVGVFAAVLGGSAIWVVPLTFVAAMVGGFLIGLSGVNLPFVELGIGLSTVVIGLAAALGRPLPIAGAMALVGLFAIFHGHAHGFEVPEGSNGLSYALGFVVATILLHVSGLLAGRVHSNRGAVRLAGATLAIVGAGVLVGWV
jgi:urease accessory protein